jgi:beta-lactamase regulating signal transducer with metallopeptidase domain
MLAAYAASLVPALGWTLVHFLWQGALVALVLRLLLKTCATARARHDLALTALVAMALAPVATFTWLKGDVQIVLVPAGFPGLGAGQGQGWEAVAVAAWLSGVTILAARAAGGLLLIERLRRSATPLPPVWAERCAALHRRMTGSLSVAFAQSEHIAAPLVAGWLKPMVLIPAAALVRLPPAQLEALILHELAHVRRLDAIANLIQTVVETALFYHPAVWWVSRQVRIEREHCCDDLAVAAVKDPALYVCALQAIEALRAAPSGVLAANGGDLRSRAARILGLAAAPERPALSRTAAILILTAAGLAMTHSAAVEAKPGVAPRTTPPATAPADPSLAPAPLASAAPMLSPPAAQAAPRIVLAEASAPKLSPLSLATAAAPQAAPTPTPAPARPIVLALAGASAGSSVSPLVVTSQGKGPPADIRIDMAGSTDDPGQAFAIWPETAYQGKYDGWVSLRCRFGVHGLAERCEVASETPTGRNFGKAALEMRTTFKIPPAMGADGPIEATKTVAIRFRAPNTRFEQTRTAPPFQEFGQIGQGRTSTDIVSGNPLAMRRVTMLDYPVWAQAASFDELAGAYPAKGGGVEGYAVAHCAVQRSGALSGCEVIKEEPERRDFGQAALKLAKSKFRVDPKLAATHHGSELWVDVPIRMPPPTQLADRTVMAPAWITGVDARTTPKIFPPEAVASGLTTGRGIARCAVGADGILTNCAPESAEPAGLGFAEAAAKLATGMKMNLWTYDAAPVEGGVVHVPIRLNLKGG